MYSLLKNSRAVDISASAVPSGVAAFAIASFFYKFGSFALECVAFLATWFVLDLVLTLIRSAIWPDPKRG